MGKKSGARQFNPQSWRKKKKKEDKEATKVRQVKQSNTYPLKLV